MKQVLIMKLGETFPSIRERKGDMDDWIAGGLGIGREHVRTVSVFEGEALPDPADCSGILLTGSHAMVTDREPWSELAAVWLRTAVPAGIPILGICYGHQLIAHAMGGKVGACRNGSEFGTADIRLTSRTSDDPLFKGFPQIFKGHVTHSQSVLELPPGASVLASNDRDAHQAFRIGQSVWGTQFHPEFDEGILKAYIEICSEMLEKEGQSPEEILKTVRQTPEGGRILRRFGEIIMANA